MSQPSMRRTARWLALAVLIAGLRLPFSASGPSAFASPAQTGGCMSPGSLPVQISMPQQNPVFTGQQLLFSASIAGAGSSASFSWNFGDGGTSSGTSVVHTYTAAGTFAVTATASIGSAMGCGSTSVVVTSASGLTSGTTGTTGTTATSTSNCGAGYSPSYGVTVTATPTTAAVAMPVSFAATASGNSPSQYTWIFGDNGTANSATTSHTYTSVGNYTAVVVTKNTPTDTTYGCGSITVMVTASGAAAAASTASTANSIPAVNTSTTAATASTASTSGATRRVSLNSGCNNITSTFPDNTPTSSLASGISQQSALVSIWRYITGGGGFQGYFPGGPQGSNDLTTLRHLDTVYVCVNTTTSLTEPAA